MKNNRLYKSQSRASLIACPALLIDIIRNNQNLCETLVTVDHAEKKSLKSVFSMFI